MKRTLEPTAESLFMTRRSVLRRLAAGSIAMTGTGAGAAMLATGGGNPVAAAAAAAIDAQTRKKILAPGVKREDILKLFPFDRPDRFDPDFKLTDPLAAGTHNNFYELLTGGGGPAWQFADKFIVDPWQVQVTGECRKPRTFDLDDLFKFEHEERVYRHRCVEAWSMVVPWSGFPLHKLLAAVEPTDHAKHVRFITANEPAQMPGMVEAIRTRAGYPWPYHEGLRIDEAMHELTLVTTGIYGKPLPKQHGAPVRIVVPWKYGYKGGKSIVKIELVRDQPDTFWGSGAYMHEYGYLSNVNPNIPHPRWSQATEFRLTTNLIEARRHRIRTPIYNGYGDEVAHLYPDEPTTPQRPLRRGQVAR
jgi:sulfoxide reductase catalytic subunit YedY